MTLPGDDNYEPDGESALEAGRTDPDEWPVGVDSDGDSSSGDGDEGMVDELVDEATEDANQGKAPVSPGTLSRLAAMVRSSLKGTRLEKITRSFMDRPREVHSTLIGLTIGMMWFSSGNAELAFQLATASLGLSRAHLHLSDTARLQITKEPWYAIFGLAIGYLFLALMSSSAMVGLMG